MATEKENTMAADAATASPIEAIVAHHAEMEEELRRRVNDLVAVVSRGEPSDPAAAAVVDYLQTTILPHAASEEATLYGAAARFEPRLIESLVAEHRALGDLISELAEVREPVSSVATAAAIAALFAIHAAKENDFVLPALIEGAPGEVPGVLASMHSEFERQSVVGAPGTRTHPTQAPGGGGAPS
jgi:iron-sulfur cluster repair protein YtfE (RIC family)